MLGGWIATGNRDRGRVEIAEALKRAGECSLVGEQARKQGLVIFQVHQLQACNPTDQR